MAFRENSSIRAVLRTACGAEREQMMSAPQPRSWVVALRPPRQESSTGGHVHIELDRQERLFTYHGERSPEGYPVYVEHVETPRRQRHAGTDVMYSSGPRSKTARQQEELQSLVARLTESLEQKTKEATASRTRYHKTLARLAAKEDELAAAKELNEARAKQVRVLSDSPVASPASVLVDPTPPKPLDEVQQRLARAVMARVHPCKHGADSANIIDYVGAYDGLELFCPCGTTVKVAALAIMNERTRQTGRSKETTDSKQVPTSGLHNVPGRRGPVERHEGLRVKQVVL